MRKPRSKVEMIRFLKGHFRYDTMSSWNASTTYAVRQKVNHLGLTMDQSDAVYAMLDVEDAYDESGYAGVLEAFAVRHDYRYQIFSNGRSSGYLVLIQGERKPSQYKSACTNCGQRNCSEATEESKRCGRCGEDARINQKMYDTVSFPGRNIDMEEDFEGWDKYSLAQRVDLVWDFDKTCATAIKCYVDYACAHKVVEETVMVPRKIKVAEEVDHA